MAFTPGFCLKYLDQSSRISQHRAPIPTSLPCTPEILLKPGLSPLSPHPPPRFVPHYPFPALVQWPPTWPASNLSPATSASPLPLELFSWKDFTFHYFSAGKPPLLSQGSVSNQNALAWHLPSAHPVIQPPGTSAQHLQHLVSSEVWLPLPEKLFCPLSAW